MLYQIKLAAKVIKELKKLDKKERSKISKQLVYLAANPFLGKKLQGE
jgi:mRNA-degrading endonuclease RelE of RelBE toxin-antitoxin system